MEVLKLFFAEDWLNISDIRAKDQRRFNCTAKPMCGRPNVLNERFLGHHHFIFVILRLCIVSLQWGHCLMHSIRVQLKVFFVFPARDLYGIFFP